MRVYIYIHILVHMIYKMHTDTVNTHTQAHVIWCFYIRASWKWIRHDPSRAVQKEGRLSQIRGTPNWYRYIHLNWYGHIYTHNDIYSSYMIHWYIDAWYGYVNSNHIIHYGCTILLCKSMNYHFHFFPMNDMAIPYGFPNWYIRSFIDGWHVSRQTIMCSHTQQLFVVPSGNLT